MIEDKELDLKIAENPDEAFWARELKSLETSHFNTKKQLLMEKHMIKFFKRKLKPFSKA